MKVNPGMLNKKIEIIEKDIDEQQVDGSGYPIEVEKVVRQCYASVNRTSGSETVKANADFSTQRIRFLVRYSKTPITTKMYVRYENKDYNIIFVNDYGDKHTYVEIWCELVTNNE